MKDFDFVVVGGGSAGYAAARTAGAAGARVAIVEKGPVGGLCILRGCMPTKALLRSTEVLQLAREAGNLGLVIPRAGFEFERIMDRKTKLVKGLQDFRIDAIRNAPNVTLIDGLGRFVGPEAIEVDGRVLRADKFMIATGSVVRVPELQGLRQCGYISSDEALELSSLPRRMVVLGGGVIACELGQFFARLGVAVTFLQRAAHLLAKEDQDVGEALQGYFEAEGIRVVSHVRLMRVERRGDAKVVVFEQHGDIHEVETDEILLAQGRVPNVAELDLGAAGVATRPGGGLEVDAQMRTTNPNIFAGGDVIGKHDLVHVAVMEGEIAGFNATHPEQPRFADYRLLAYAVFCDPNLGIVGLTEKKAALAGRPVAVGKFPFADLGKAELIDQTRGFVKLLADPETGEILGGEVLGPEGSDLIHEIITAMAFRATAQQLLEIPHLHPTLSEIWTYPAEEIVDRLNSGALAAIK